MFSCEEKDVQLLPGSALLLAEQQDIKHIQMF